jgi:hypothetical protein
MIENRERMEDGIGQLPRTRTSSVPVHDQQLYATTVIVTHHLELRQSNVWDRNS